jgi:hypothetical protein
MKLQLNKYILFCLFITALFTAFSPALAISEEVRKGKYIINLSSEQKVKGKYFILQIEGDITGPSCNLMRLNVYFLNEYANRANKIFLIENIQDNVPVQFSDYDEIFPTKEKTTWKVNEVSAECKD